MDRAKSGAAARRHDDFARFDSCRSAFAANAGEAGIRGDCA